MACKSASGLDEESPLLQRDVDRTTDPGQRRTQRRPDGGRCVGCVGRSCSFFHSSHIVLAVVFLERVAMYGTAVNLVQFLSYRDYLRWSTVEATIAVLVSIYLAYCGAVVTGFIADTRVGRINMLLAGQVFQGCGALCLMTSSFVENCTDVSSKFNQALIIMGLILLGMGIAMAMGTEIPLGLDQYEVERAHYSTARSYFPYYCFLVNAGSVVGMTLVSFIQYNFLFGIGFSIPALFSAASAVLLWSCRKRLHTPPPERDSPLFNVWKVVREARRVKKSNQQLSGVWWPGSNPTELAMTAHWVQYAERRLGGSFTHNEVAYVQNFLAVVYVILCTMFYEVTVAQTLTAFSAQANLMSLPVKRGNAPMWRDGDCSIPPHAENLTTELFVPPSVFVAMSPLAVMIFIPFLHCVIYPCWRSCSNGVAPSQLKRILAGMLAAIMCLLCALLVEVNRTPGQSYNATNYASHSSKIVYVSDLSVLWQIPQYLFSGLGEALAVVSALDFSYMHAPPKMRGTCVGLVYATQGLSALLSLACLMAVEISGSSIYYSLSTPAHSNSLAQARSDVHVYYIILLCIVAFGILPFGLAVQQFRIVPAHSTTTKDPPRSRTATHG